MCFKDLVDCTHDISIDNNRDHGMKFYHVNFFSGQTRLTGKLGWDAS